MTNFEKIKKAEAPEELRDALFNGENLEVKFCNAKGYCEYDCNECFKAWLNEEAEE